MGRAYVTLPIEKKSYRRLEVAEPAKKILSKANMVTIIADWENDIYLLKLSHQKLNST